MPDSVVAPVTRQGSWELLYVAGIPDPTFMFTDTGALSDPAAYAHRTASSIWPSSLSGSNELISFEGPELECNSLSLSFYGTDGGGSSPYHAIGALWVVRTLEFDSDTEYRGTFLCEFELGLGGEERDSTGGILPDGVKWVKSINVVKDRALFPGVRIVGQEGNAPPELILDGIGGLGYVLELRCRKPTGADGSAMAAVGAMRRIL